jgi:hypothetical protein
VSVFSLVMCRRTLGSIASQNALKLQFSPKTSIEKSVGKEPGRRNTNVPFGDLSDLDHLSLSSINLVSLVLLSSIKRRQICSTFDRYTLISSLRYWPSRQRNGRSAFSLKY